MACVISIGACKKSFSLEEANSILPVIIKISHKHSFKVTQLFQKIEMLGENGKVDSKIESAIDESIRIWKEKVIKLNAIPRGLWRVDFPWVSTTNPSDRGYFCWKFPEKSILYWHGSSGGNSSRVAIDEWRKRFFPRERLNKVSRVDRIKALEN